MDAVIAIAFSTLKLVLRVYYYLLFARAVISWLPIEGNRLTDFVYGATELILAPVRKIVDRFTGNSFMPIDLSYIVVLILITVLLNVL